MILRSSAVYRERSTALFGGVPISFAVVGDSDFIPSITAHCLLDSSVPAARRPAFPSHEYHIRLVHSRLVPGRKFRIERHSPSFFEPELVIEIVQVTIIAIQYAAPAINGSRHCQCTGTLRPSIVEHVLNIAIRRNSGADRVISIHEQRMVLQILGRHMAEKFRP